jgi:hypothetical protein
MHLEHAYPTPRDACAAWSGDMMNWAKGGLVFFFAVMIAIWLAELQMPCPLRIESGHSRIY